MAHNVLEVPKNYVWYCHRDINSKLRNRDSYFSPKRAGLVSDRHIQLKWSNNVLPTFPIDFKIGCKSVGLEAIITSPNILFRYMDHQVDQDVTGPIRDCVVYDDVTGPIRDCVVVDDLTGPNSDVGVDVMEGEKAYFPLSELHGSFYSKGAYSAEKTPFLAVLPTELHS